MSASELFKLPDGPERAPRRPNKVGSDFDKRLQQGIAENRSEAESLLKRGSENRSRETVTEFISLGSRRQAEVELTQSYRVQSQGIARPRVADLCFEVVKELGKAYNEVPKEETEDSAAVIAMSAELGPFLGCLADVAGTGTEWNKFTDRLMQEDLPTDILRALIDARSGFVLPGDRAYDRERAPTVITLRDAYLNPVVGISTKLFKDTGRSDSLKATAEHLHHILNLAARFGQSAGQAVTEGGYRFFKQEVTGFQDPVFNRLCDIFAQISHYARLQGEFYEEDVMGNVRPIVSWLVDRLPYSSSEPRAGEEQHLEFQSALGALLTVAVEKPAYVSALVLAVSEFLTKDPASPEFRRPVEGETEESTESQETRYGADAVSKGLGLEIADQAFAKFGKLRKVHDTLLDAFYRVKDNRLKARAIETLMIFKVALTPTIEKELETIITNNLPGRASAIRFFAEKGTERHADFLASAMRSLLRDYPKYADRCRRIAFALGSIYARMENQRTRQTIARHVEGLPMEIEKMFGKGSKGTFLVISGGGPVGSPPEEDVEVEDDEEPKAEPAMSIETFDPTPRKDVSNVIQRLRKGDTSEKVAAIAELEKNNTPAAIEALIETVEEKNLVLKQNALLSLEKMGSAAVPFIISKVESIYGKLLAMHKDDRVRPYLEILWRMIEKGVGSAKENLDRLQIAMPRLSKVVDEVRTDLEERGLREKRREQLHLTPRELAERNAANAPVDATSLDAKIKAHKARLAGQAESSYEMSEEEAEKEKARLKKARQKFGIDVEKSEERKDES